MDEVGHTAIFREGRLIADTGMGFMPTISAAINGLYETFGRYPRPERIECCPCGCTKPDATDPLLVTSLRGLRFLELADYSFSAMTTQGSVDDFRYFLPRLLQGIAEEPYSYSSETIFHKLSYAKWATWPAGEQASLKRYLNALWQCSLGSFPIEEHLPAFFEIETVLSSIAQTGEPLSPYLTVWAETTTKAADEHLIQFVTMYGTAFTNGETFNDGFWRDAPSQALELRRWLLQPKTLLRTRKAAYLLRNDGFEHLFPPSVEALEAESVRST